MKDSMLSKQVSVLICMVILFQCSGSKSNHKILTQMIQKQDYCNIVEATGVLEAIKTVTIACPGLRTDATITNLVPEGSMVQPGDTICILQATEIENEYKQSLRSLEEAKAEYNKSIANLHLQYLMLESQMNTINAQTKISNLDSTQLAFSSDFRKQVIQLEMEKADIEREKIKMKLDFLKRINESELKKMKARIKQEENKVARKKELLDKLVLKTDVGGMVVYDRVWSTGMKAREGDIVWWTCPIVKIPDMSKMQVKLTVNDTKYKQIEVKQPIQIQVDAFPEVKLKGEITKKPPVGKPIKDKSRIKVFEIYASVDTIKTTLYPGLSVSCNIIVETIPDTLVVPMCAVFEKDSIKIIYKKNGHKYISQPVELVKNNASYAIVSKGLDEMDVIALSEPADAWIEQQEEEK